MARSSTQTEIGEGDFFNLAGRPPEKKYKHMRVTLSTWQFLKLYWRLFDFWELLRSLICGCSTGSG